MKYIYIVNRFNLKEKTDAIIERLKSASEEFGREYEIVVNETTEEGENCFDRFKDSEFVITSIGGDGSINRVLNGIWGTKNILSFIPGGTGNDFYHYCTDRLKDGIHEADVIRINDSYFINVACFGIDADIANDDNFIHNRFIPKSMRYNAGVIYYFLTYQPRYMKVEVGEKVIEGRFTTVAATNARYYGNGYSISPCADFADGSMEILMAGSLDKINMAKTILSMKDAGHLKNPAVRVFNTDRAVISSDRPFKANIDGEALEATRFELEVLPKAVRLEFDQKFIDKMCK